MLKGPYLFRRKIGFKFSDCLKISLTTVAPAIAISFLVNLLTGINLSTVFAFVFIARMLFIYFKYIYPKNNIFIQIYNETKEERFNVL